MATPMSKAVDVAAARLESEKVKKAIAFVRNDESVDVDPLKLWYDAQILADHIERLEVELETGKALVKTLYNQIWLYDEGNTL